MEIGVPNLTVLLQASGRELEQVVDLDRLAGPNGAVSCDASHDRHSSVDMGSGTVEAILLLLIEDIAQHNGVATAMAAYPLLNFNAIWRCKVRVDHDIHALQSAFIRLIATGIDVGLLGDPYFHTALCTIKNNNEAFPWQISI